MEVQGRPWFYTLVPKEDGRRSVSLMDKIPRSQLYKKLVVCLSHPSGDGQNGQNGKDLRLFSAFNSYSEFYRYQLLFKEKERCFFEVILGEFPQKDHFDIEMTTEKVDAEKLDSTAERLMEQLISSVKAQYLKEGVSLPDNSLLVFSSHGPAKRSFHLVVDGYARHNVKECERFYKDVVSGVDKDLHGFIDHSVYKSLQQFRILGSQKRDSSRPKLFLSSWAFGAQKGTFSLPSSLAEEAESDLAKFHILEASLISRSSGCVPMKPCISSEVKEHTFKDDGVQLSKAAALSVLDLIASNAGISRRHYRFPYELKEVEGRMVLLKRKAPSFCPICERVHQNENPFAIVSPSNEVFFNCRRGDKSLKIGVIEEIEEPAQANKKAAAVEIKAKTAAKARTEVKAETAEVAKNAAAMASKNQAAKEEKKDRTSHIMEALKSISPEPLVRKKIMSDDELYKSLPNIPLFKKDK